MDPNTSVLYLEDDPSSRKVMELLLKKRLGLQHVYIFEDSHAFVERIAALDPLPQMIFLDIHMGPHNGFEVLAALRRDSRYDRIPILAMTASVMNEEVERLMTSGFDGCIAKPIDTHRFTEALISILNGEAVWQITQA
jgi:CheY-like chemotaxis protein